MLKKISTLLLGCSLAFLSPPLTYCSDDRQEADKPSSKYLLKSLPPELKVLIVKHARIGDGLALMKTDKDFFEVCYKDAALWKDYCSRVEGHQHYQPTKEQRQNLAKFYRDMLRDLGTPKLNIFVFDDGDIFHPMLSGDGRMLSTFLRIRGNDNFRPFIFENKPNAKPNPLPGADEYMPIKMTHDGNFILGRKLREPIFTSLDNLGDSILWEFNEAGKYQARPFPNPDANNFNRYIITDMDSTGTLFVGHYLELNNEHQKKAFRTNFKGFFEYLDLSKNMSANFISGDGSTVTGVRQKSNSIKVYKWTSFAGRENFSEENSMYKPSAITVTGDLVIIDGSKWGDFGNEVENYKIRWQKKSAERVTNFNVGDFNFSYQINATGERNFLSTGGDSEKDNALLYLVDERENEKKIPLNSILEPLLPSSTRLGAIQNVSSDGLWFNGIAYKYTGIQDCMQSYTAFIPAYHDFEREGVSLKNKPETSPSSTQDANTRP